MLGDILLWALVLVAVLGVLSFFVYPPLRPYAKLSLWLGIGVVGSLLAFIFFRHRSSSPGRPSSEPPLLGLGQIIEKAQEEVLRVEAEFALAKVEAEEAKEEFKHKIEAVQSIDNSVERRKALLKLVESQKR